jgi:hypothetical protein
MAKERGNEMTMAPEDGVEESMNAQVFCLGAPLRLVDAWSQYSRSHRNGKYHYLEIEAGQHTIVVECSPSGKSVRVTIDEREMTL